MLFLQLLTKHAGFCQMRLLRACLADFFLPLFRQCLVTTSLDSLVMVRWVERPYNHVSRDVGNVFSSPHPCKMKCITTTIIDVPFENSTDYCIRFLCIVSISAFPFYYMMPECCKDDIFM